MNNFAIKRDTNRFELQYLEYLLAINDENGTSN